MLRNKLVGIALAAPLAFAIGAVGPAYGAEKKEEAKAEAKKGKNVDAAKRGTTPQTEAAAMARLADQLARYGDKNKDALAMIEAAKIFNEVGVRDEKREKKTEGAAAGDGKEGASKTRDQSVTALLARAREYAGGRKDLIALADEAAKSTKRGAYNPVRHIDRVRGRATDVYTVTFRGGEPAFLAISGDGDTDLDLFVYDQNGNLICSSNSSGDDEACRWYPRWTGPFVIRVRNLGSVYNEYRMWSN